MKAPFPSFTSEWHNKPYTAIDPTSPALSHNGQTAVITGAGSGIGQATSIAYALAGASRIALIGRRRNKLEETQEQILEKSPNCHVEIYSVDFTKAKEMQEVADHLTAWDVLVLNAGRTMRPASIEKVDLDDWWNVTEVNLRGYVTTLRTFLPSRKSAARIIGVSAGAVNFPPEFHANSGLSAYATSKLSQIRLQEHVASECPDVFTVSVHPGVIATDFVPDQTEADMKAHGIPVDDVKLPAHFLVWTSSKDASFLRGKFCYANWDVEQLKEKAQEIRDKPILTTNIVGWPFE